MDLKKCDKCGKITPAEDTKDWVSLTLFDNEGNAVIFDLDLCNFCRKDLDYLLKDRGFLK